MADQSGSVGVREGSDKQMASLLRGGKHVQLIAAVGPNGEFAYGATTVGGTASELDPTQGGTIDHPVMVRLVNHGDNTVYWAYNNSVTDSNGMPIFAPFPEEIPVGPDTRIWLIKKTGASDQNVRYQIRSLGNDP